MTEVTLSSENMKLSYFQKILFYEPRPNPEGGFCLQGCLFDLGEASGVLLGGGRNFAQYDDCMIGAVDGVFLNLFQLQSQFFDGALGFCQLLARAPFMARTAPPTLT